MSLTNVPEEVMIDVEKMVDDYVIAWQMGCHRSMTAIKAELKEMLDGHNKDGGERG